MEILASFGGTPVGATREALRFHGNLVEKH